MTKRTFAILPGPSEAILTHWRAAVNTVATDEITAHMGMFNPRSNDGFYDLGLATVRLIAARLEDDGVKRASGSQGDAASVSGRMGSATGTADDPILVDV